jgi:hypothetical protein
MHYIKHLVECNCILKIFEDVRPVVFHKFVVFSTIQDVTGDIIPSYAQCNNCLAIHKVVEVGQSQTIKKEELRSLPSIEEIELEIPEKVSAILQKNECELHVWQEARHILEYKLWGKFIVLSKEKEGSTTLGKALVIHGENMFKIETFEQED